MTLQTINQKRSGVEIADSIADRPGFRPGSIPVFPGELAEDNFLT